MQIENKWIRGPARLVTPSLPASCHGAVGCRFEKAIFDPRVGNEVYLLVLDSPEFANSYANTRPFNLLATPGLVRTTNGIVAYIVWSIAARSTAETEQFLNPQNGETIALVSAVAQQSHLKALIADSHAGNICDWFEFENKFGFGEFCASMAQSIEHEPVGDFQAAMAEVTASYSTNELRGF